MPVCTHDYHVGSDVHRMLAQRFVHAASTARNLVDFHFHAMAREKRGNISARLFAVPKLLATGSTSVMCTASQPLRNSRDWRVARAASSLESQARSIDFGNDETACMRGLTGIGVGDWDRAPSMILHWRFSRRRPGPRPTRGRRSRHAVQCRRRPTQIPCRFPGCRRTVQCFLVYSEWHPLLRRDDRSASAARRAKLP